MKIPGWAVFGVVMAVISVVMSENGMVQDYMHSNVFISGHEIMEVMAACPFDSDTLCYKYRDECIKRINQGALVSEEEIADCARVVEEKVLEGCGDMGVDCGYLR